MPQVTIELSLEEIETAVLQLSPPDLFKLAETIEERAETIGMMGLAETGFREWDEEGEDIYDAET